MSAVKRVLQALSLTKIAAVDAPCQEPALAVITKRAADYEDILKAKYDTDARREMAANGEAMSDGSYPIKDAADLENAIHAVGRGRNNSHAAIRAHIKRRAKALGLTDKLPETWGDGEKLSKALHDALRKGGVMISQSDEDEGAETFEEALGDQQLTQAFWDCFCRGTTALEGSLMSILKDDAVAEKGPLITQSLQQFADYVEQGLPASLGKSLAATIRGSLVAGETGAPTLKRKEPAVSDAVKKALGLDANATEADVLKAVEHASNLAKMSEKHKAYMESPKGTMPKGGKEAFAAMEPSERDSHISAHPLDDGDGDEDVAKALKSGDAFKTPEGVIIRKAKVGDELFSVLKNQNDRLVATQSDLAKAQERQVEADFAKRATDMGMEPDFGAVIRKAYGGDATAQAEVEKRIRAFVTQVEEAGLFKSFGGAGGEGSAESEFMAKVEEVRKAEPKLTPQQAYAKAYTDRGNAEIVKRMKAEASA